MQASASTPDSAASQRHLAQTDSSPMGWAISYLRLANLSRSGEAAATGTRILSSLSPPSRACLRPAPWDPHVRLGQKRALGRKVSDEIAIPLCRTRH